MIYLCLVELTTIWATNYKNTTCKEKTLSSQADKGNTKLLYEFIDKNKTKIQNLIDKIVKYFNEGSDILMKVQIY